MSQNPATRCRKQFTDELAWTVQRELVDSYFRRRFRRDIDPEPEVEVEETVTVTETVANAEIYLESARILATVPDSQRFVVNCLRHLVPDIYYREITDIIETLEVNKVGTAITVVPEPMPEEVKQQVTVTQKKYFKQGMPCDVVKLQRVMSRRNITMKKLAEKSGISITTVSNLLSGKHRPTLDTREKICKALKENNDFLTP